MHTYTAQSLISKFKMQFLHGSCLLYCCRGSFIHSIFNQHVLEILVSLPLKVYKEKFYPLPQEYYFTIQSLRLSENIF